MSHCFRPVVLSLVLCTLTVLAQDSPNPTFKSSTELVLVPTIVTDNSGKHALNLKKEDFALKADGKPRPITVFEEVTTDSARFRRATGQQGEYSNFQPEGQHYHRLTIIALDLINTPFNDLSNARKALLDFLSRAAESGEPMCLLAMDRGGVRVIHGFTEDPKILAEAVNTLRANPASLQYEQTVSSAAPPPGGDTLSRVLREMIRSMLQNEKQLQSTQRKDTVLLTLDELNQIAGAFGGLPGRKALIWASSGFVYSLSTPADQMCDTCSVDQRSAIQAQYDRMWQNMNNSQMAIYSVDLRSLAAGNFQANNDEFTHPYDVGDPEYDKAAQAKWEAQDVTSSLRLFAENTGGKAFTNTNDLSAAFRQAVDDDSQYYLLGFYVDHVKDKPGWHKLSVAVERKGIHARFRNGFIQTAPKDNASDRQQLSLALASPLDFTGVPMTVSWSGSGPAKESGKIRVQFDLVMPMNFAQIDENDRNHLSLEIAAVARDQKNAVSGQVSQKIDNHLSADAMAQIQQHGMTYRSALQLAPGAYTVRFVVRDGLTGRIGSLAAPLKVAQ